MLQKNKGKVNSLSNDLSKYGIHVVQIELELPEPRSDNLQEIARGKVLFAYNQIQKPCVALDAGFYVESLNGFPRAFVNFALETIGIEGILKLAEGKPKECEFRNCLAYMDNKISEPVYFESKTEGILSEILKGETKPYHWSKLFQIFVPKGLDKTLAEMSYEEYLDWKAQRHKVSSTAQFAEWYAQQDCFSENFFCKLSMTRKKNQC